MSVKAPQQSPPVNTHTRTGDFPLISTGHNDSPLYDTDDCVKIKKAQKLLCPLFIFVSLPHLCQ